MAESTAAFPYETRLNILHGPLERIDVKALADACEFKWFNQTLCQVNGSVVRVGVIEGEYHWHKHDADDEFFYTVEGLAPHRSGGSCRRTCTGTGLRGSTRRSAPHAGTAAHGNPDGGERGDHPHG